jgi:hypothetical protein
VSAHVRRIEAVEKDLKALADSSAGKEDLSRVRAEIKRLYDGLHIGQWFISSLSISIHISMLQNSSTSDHTYGVFVSIHPSCSSVKSN